MNSTKSYRLPNGLDFSPYYEGILQGALAICASNNGDRKASQQRIAEVFYGDKNRPLPMAANCLSGMKAYGLITTDSTPTEFGFKLLEIDDIEELYDTFAHHLLLNCNGYLLIEAIGIIEASNGWAKDRKGQIAELLKDLYGIEPSGSGGTGKSVSTMKRWLEETGVIEGKTWKPNQKKIDALLGMQREAIDSLGLLSYEEACFMKTLIDLHLEGNAFDARHPSFINSSTVRAATEERFGVKLSATHLPKTMLKPLEEYELIEVNSGKRGGRNYIRPTEMVLDKNLTSFVEHLGLGASLGPKIKAGLKMSYPEVLKMCKSTNTNKKGLGLEILALKILKSAGLSPIAMRHVDDKPSSPEIDLLFLDERGTHSMWQVQCKNTKTVSGDRVYREIGIALVAHRNVICIISTGGYTKQAMEAAQKANTETSMMVLLIEKSDISKLVSGTTSATTLLKKKMEEVRRVKSGKVRTEYGFEMLL